MICPEHTYILTWNLDYDDYSIAAFQNEMQKLRILQEGSDYRQSILHPERGLMRASGIEASLNNWKEAKRGDRFFMYLVSDRPGFKKRIVGSGFFYDDPFFDGRWTSPKNGSAYTVKLDYDVMLNPETVHDLLTEDVLSLQFPDYDWEGNTPDFVLDAKTAYILEKKWYSYFLSLNIECDGKEFWCRSKIGFEDMFRWKDQNGSWDWGREFFYTTHLLMKIRPKEPIEVVRQRIRERQKQEQESNKNNE